MSRRVYAYEPYERWRLAGHTCTPPTRGEVPGCPACEKPGGYLDKLRAQRTTARDRRRRRDATGRFLESIGIHELSESPSCEALRALVLSLPQEERAMTLAAMDICRRCGRDLRDPIVEECPCLATSPRVPRRRR